MELKEELKNKVIEALNLDDLTAADIEDNAPLFGNDGLGLDSIDALELIVMLEKSNHRNGRSFGYWKQCRRKPCITTAEL